LAGGHSLEADAVVALPKLSVPELPGVPQGPEGFIPTNDYGGVEGLLRVYAAGDATWFPIKQGGIAAQQADAVATSIAACAGVKIKPQRLKPVLRGLLLTGEAPHYLRSSIGERDDSSASGSDALWWPPAKIAGRYLASYLAGDERGRPLEDLETVVGEPGHRREEYTAALELALTAADADARWGDRAGALRWLEVAEQLNVVLPPEYTEKRRRWTAATTPR
jgi:sulfide:quinone oxidoreductase